MHTHAHILIDVFSVSFVAGLHLAASHRFQLCVGLTSKCAFYPVHIKCLFIKPLIWYGEAISSGGRFIKGVLNEPLLLLPPTPIQIHPLHVLRFPSRVHRKVKTWTIRSKNITRKNWEKPPPPKMCPRSDVFPFCWLHNGNFLFRPRNL